MGPLHHLLEDHDNPLSYDGRIVADQLGVETQRAASPSASDVVLQQQQQAGGNMVAHGKTTDKKVSHSKCFSLAIYISIELKDK